MMSKKKGDKSKNSRLKHRYFWIVFISTFVISLIVIASSNSQLSLTGNVALQTIAYLQADSEFNFEVRNVIGVKDATLQVVEDVKNVLIKIEDVEEVSWIYSGKFYSKFKISSEDENKFGKIRLTLKIPESDLSEIGIPEQEIALFRDGKELVTEMIKKENNFIYYSAVSTGFGEFVIGKSKPKEVQESIKEEVNKKPNSSSEEPPLIEKELPKKEGIFQKIINFLKKIIGK